LVIAGAAAAIAFGIDRRVVPVRAVLVIGAPSNVPAPRLPPRSVQGPTPPHVETGMLPISPQSVEPDITRRYREKSRISDIRGVRDTTVIRGCPPACPPVTAPC